MLKVYLAGGTVSGWQRTIMDNFVKAGLADKVDFYNPSDFEVGSVQYPAPAMYAPINKLKIEQCDFVFAFLEASNPTPINTALEVGYALALGKKVLFCHEWTQKIMDSGYLKTLFTDQEGAVGTWFKPHYLAQILNWCDFVETDFGIAIELFKKVVEYEIDERSPVTF